MNRLFWHGVVAVLACSGGGCARTLTLVADGNPKAVIVTPDEPSETVRMAVDELNHWVERLTGTRLREVSHAAWDGQWPVVAVGPSPFMPAHGIDAGSLGPEGARVVVTNRYVALLGRDEAPLDTLSWYGTYYAVLELIKCAFGVRFLWPGELGEVYESRSTLSVPAGSWTWETPLVVRRSLRNVYSDRSHDTLSEQLERIAMPVPRDVWTRHADDTQRWLRRHRMNTPSTIAFGHSFTAWWDRYGEQHPDWFAHPPEGRKRPGGKGQKLCVSNPELRQRIFEEWYDAWRQDPARNRSLRACPNDSRGFCICARCREWDGPDQAHFTDMQVYAAPEPRVTDRYVRFWNDLAERAASVDPEVVITGYAYRSYRRPPQHTRVHPSVVIGYVGGEGFYPLEEHLREEWQRWADAGAQMHWRPNLLHCGHYAPYLFARQLASDFGHFHRNRMIGTDFDSLASAWATQGPNYYVLAELHARPEADVEELLREYCAAFGPAAGEVLEYFDYWEEVTLNGPTMLEELLRPARLTWGQWTPGFIQLLPRLYTPAVLAEGEAILQRAEAKTSAMPIARDRVAFLRIGFEHTRLTAAALREVALLQAKDHGASLERLRQARAALRAFREQHAGSIAIPVFHATGRELRYKNTSPVWLLKE